jgi:hypothetical protein
MATKFIVGRATDKEEKFVQNPRRILCSGCSMYKFKFFLHLKGMFSIF